MDRPGSRWLVAMANRAAQVLVIGESLIDVVVRSDGPTSSHVGGSPANVAVGLARLGHQVELATSFAADPYGKQITAHLLANGVTVTAGSEHAGNSSTATARLDAAGAATYQFEIVWSPAGLEPTTAPEVIHTGSIASWLEPGGSRVLERVRRSVRAATISFDPNIRAQLIADRAATTQRVEAFAAVSDIVKVSDEDLDWLYPGIAPTDIAERWLTGSTSVVFITRGASGAIGLSDNAAIEISSPPTAVVDTIGAGDAFMAGLLDAAAEAQLLGPASRSALAAVDEPTLRQLGTHAAHVAALTVARAGAEPPTCTELRAAVRPTRRT